MWLLTELILFVLLSNPTATSKKTRSYHFEGAESAMICHGYKIFEPNEINESAEKGCVIQKNFYKFGAHRCLPLASCFLGLRPYTDDKNQNDEGKLYLSLLNVGKKKKRKKEKSGEIQLPLKT